MQETLALLEGLSRERLQTLLTNWYRATKGKFKVPIFAHQELDLHKVFWEVQNRGGSQLVTDQKMWKVPAFQGCSELDVLVVLVILSVTGPADT